jgi:signal peptide peptidase-like protein 2B
MLGYGDVILPGLLIVHNHLFDNSANQTIRARNAWLFPSLVMYVFGLLVTFAALHFEVGGQGGQPALCYLTPTVVGGTVLYARARGDFDRMWAGDAGEEEEGYIAGEGDRERLMPRYSSV